MKAPICAINVDQLSMQPTDVYLQDLPQKIPRRKDNYWTELMTCPYVWGAIVTPNALWVWKIYTYYQGYKRGTWPKLQQKHQWRCLTFQSGGDIQICHRMVHMALILGSRILDPVV